MAVKRQVIAGVATLAALYVGVSNALGLGELRLDSALNQPLSATIQLQGAEGLSPDDVLVSLANQQAFADAGIERPFFLTDLRFIPVVENNRLFIRVESTRPVREPYLNFLVELRRPNGRMLREYTLLLDPPLYDPQTGVIASAPPPVPQVAPARPSVAATPSRQQAEARRELELPDLQPQSGANSYTTVRGDTLWDIAAAQRPDRSVSIRTNMLAIRALNPDAFVDGDIDRLRAGHALVMPTAEQLVAAGAPAGILEGRAEPRAPEPTADSEPQPVVGTSPAPSVRPEEDPADPAEPEAVAGAPDESDVDARLRIEESGVEVAEADSAVLLDRLRSLESRFNVLLSELDARDAQIASLQAELDVLRQARDAETRGDESLAGMTGAGSLGGGAPGSGPGAADGSDDPAPGSINANVLPGEQSADAPTSSSWLAWLTLPLVLVAFLFGLFIARRRNSEPEEERSAAVEPQEPVAPTGFASNITTVPAMVARPVAQAPKPAVDPLDGVELYMTYGRFAEARVMLDKAIDEEPERLDLRYKQLRVLAELGDAPAFNELEQEIVELGGDRERVDLVKARFPLLFDNNGDMVEQAEVADPMLDDDLEIGGAEFRSGIDEVHDQSSTSQLNLNDFTLDPDWDLIEGLSPEPGRRNVEKMDAAREVQVSRERDDNFETSLHEFPEVEELDDDHRDHFLDLNDSDAEDKKR